MSTRYQIKLYNQLGQYVRDVTQFFSLDIVRTENTVGALRLDLPPVYNLEDFAVDSQLAIYAAIDNLPARLLLDTVYFVRKSSYVIENGRTIIRLTAADANDLLARRIINYVAGSSQASKSGTVDVVVKAIVTDNFVSRNALSHFTVSAASTAGPTITQSFAWRNVLTVIQDIANASAQLGTYYSFEVFALGPDNFEFRSYFGQRGLDRTMNASNAPTVMSIENKRLGNVSLTSDHTNEANVVICAGQGEGADRTKITVQDDTALNATPYSRVEQFKDSRNNATVAAVTTDANTTLRESRALTLFEATVQQTPTNRFGLEYDFGDTVTAVFLGQSFDCRLSSIEIALSDGKETITSKLRSVS